MSSARRINVLFFTTELLIIICLGRSHKSWPRVVVENVIFQVDVKMDPEQEWINRFRQQNLNEINRSRRKMDHGRD